MSVLLKKALYGRGIKPEVYTKFGVRLAEGSRGDWRIVFPLTDLYGVPTGTAYRSEQVKFFYATDNDVAPTDMIYGIDKTWQHIRRLDYAIVVEGPFDMLGVYSSGIPNVVSTLGANMSWAQMSLLARFCKTAFLCYDPDAAGRQATRKAASILKQGGLLPVPVYLNKDPDEFVAKYGPGQLLETCFQSLSAIDPDRFLKI